MLIQVTRLLDILAVYLTKYISLERAIADRAHESEMDGVFHFGRVMAYSIAKMDMRGELLTLLVGQECDSHRIVLAPVSSLAAGSSRYQYSCPEVGLTRLAGSFELGS